MFKKTEDNTATLIRQGEKIFELEEENLNLSCYLADAQENTSYILDYLQYTLERNSYNNEELRKRKALEFIKDITKSIETDGLENLNIKELLNTTDIS